MIRIQEAETEYLLFIPAAQRERAKGIQGRSWDPQRVCWVYPRTTRVYHALVAEFGDDLTSKSKFTSPPSFRRREENENQDTARLQERIEGIDKTLSELLGFLNHTDKERTNVLMRQERAIQSLKDELQGKNREVAGLKRRIDQLKTENSRLYEEVKMPADSDRQSTVKELALEVTGHDRVFGEYFKSFEIKDSLPIEIASLLRNHLRKVYNSEGDLFDLIRECEDDQILDRFAVSVAHALRTQRNKVAYLDEPEDPRIARGRALFCLFGASLLFPELPEVAESQPAD